MSQQPVIISLENYDLTRKVFAVNTMDTLNRLINIEAAKPNPDLVAISSLATSLAALLSSVT